MVNITDIYTMSYGRPYIMKIDGAIHDGWLLLRLRDKTVIDENYLYELLKSENIKKQYEKNATGGVVKNLNSEIVRNIEIPLPPLEIQQKIISEIEQYQKVIDGCDLLIENYKPSFEVKEDWEMVRMSNLSTFVRGPFGGSLKKEIFVENGYLVYEQSHAIQNDVTIGRYFIDEEKFNEMKRFEVLPDDILMSCSGTFGKVVLIPSNARKGIINQALLKIKPDIEVVRPLFLKLLMESSAFQSQIMQGVSGVAIKNVASVDEIKNIEIQLPDLDIQDQLINEYEKERQTISGLEDLKIKMQHKIKEVIDKVWGK